eukprot:scaffold42931_cov69-Phaeocystis_antarctica.AAC.3
MQPRAAHAPRDPRREQPGGAVARSDRAVRGAPARLHRPRTAATPQRAVARAAHSLRAELLAAREEECAASPARHAAHLPRVAEPLRQETALRCHATHRRPEPPPPRRQLDQPRGGAPREARRYLCVPRAHRRRRTRRRGAEAIGCPRRVQSVPPHRRRYAAPRRQRLPRPPALAERR